MGHIEHRKQKSGATSYRAIVVVDGKHVSRTFPRAADAKRWVTTQEASVLHGAWVDPKAGRMTFGAYAEAWAARQPHRASTAAVTASRLRSHLLPALGERPLASLRASDMKALVGTLGQTLAPGTVETVYRLAATILKAAVEDGHLAKSPCPARIALPRRDGRKIDPMSVEQVWAMADAVPDRYAAAVVAAAGLGLRQGELFGLTVDHVDWLRRTVKVDRQLVSAVGSAPTLGPVKTEASNRTVPAPTTVLEALTDHLRTFGEGPGGLLFSTAQGKAVRRSLAAATWRAAATRAGLPETTGWHALRHFYASALISAGESVKVVQARLGHKSALETLDVYGHLWPDSEESTRAALDGVLRNSHGVPTARAATP